ncbi:AMP-binding enzyme family protein (macronuclear) [Tetrahymena thermophila SB210]|uniref:AMP-binding enzyme family protein n=1 Tax=Tetrahymena thermophila (strain SB210) TaxID=312017 RepID=Q23JE8_TETTS|nr:AMP-binding enzyme family protein [Tetrahymena thermophila SB210]EAR96556.2 AMP-binding enzyme family protein [Tetrahymena thermophila SB210]|eukprot:XP_001016801.2 AMP-binding enzyme family protein [Tetrahymena thermophila SB210]
MKMFLFDLFSSEFYFNLDGSHYKKSTLQGVVLSLASITLVVSYFAYLLNQYLNNFIDPLYKSQSFITSDRKEIQLTDDLVGFQFQYNNSLSIQQYEVQQNKTYLVYYPLFYYQDTINNIYQIINLTVIQCTAPELKGYNCIDFSPIRNYTLLRHNSNGIMSQLQINIYGCLDLDSFKTTTPSNCAPQKDIDDVINGGQAGLNIQLKTQQYNTSSMTQMQETTVKQGLIIQGQQFSLQTGFGPYNQITIVLDEIVQQIQVQYATITQILALHDLPKLNFKVELKTQEKDFNKCLGNAIAQKLSIMKNSEIKKVIQSTIFKFQFFKSQEFLQSKGVEKKQMDKMRQEVQQNLNINELYKDVIFLKKAMSMLLSLDQMASIQLVGLTDNFMNLDLQNKNQKISYDQEKKKLNHFERQYSILQSEKLQTYYIERFLIKCQENCDLSEVDQRIFSSITKKNNLINYF